MRTAIFGDAPFIIASGQRSGVPQTTTLLINSDTLETVPLANTSTLTFALAFDAENGVLYSANINRNVSPSRTEILMHTAPSFEDTELVFSVEGEFFDASIDTKRGVVFLSVGGEEVVKTRGSRRFERIERANAIPRSVSIYGDWLFSLNRDSSISLWQVGTKEHVATFYLTENGGWVAIGGDGELIDASTEGREYIVGYE